MYDLLVESAVSFSSNWFLLRVVIICVYCQCFTACGDNRCFGGLCCPHTTPYMKSLLIRDSETIMVSETQRGTFWLWLWSWLWYGDVTRRNV